MNNHDEMLPFYEAETAAIQRGDPDRRARRMRRPVRS